MNEAMRITSRHMNEFIGCNEVELIKDLETVEEAEVDMDWHEGSSTYELPDGSAIKICATEVSVRNDPESPWILRG